MATLLLIIIYIAFIGLGIPDSLFGTAWPAIYVSFEIPISSANYVTLLISCGTVISSALSARIINRFGTAVVTAVSTAITAAALFGFSVSGNLLWLCIFSIPMGLGAGAVDSALNNYVALHYKATHMNFLHCFYGIGVSVSPYLMSLALTNENNWRDGYRLAFYLQLAIALITIVSIPLWKKAHPASLQSNEEIHPKTLSIINMLKMPSVRAVLLIFIGSCAIECTCGTWGSTFLVNSKGMSVDHAAKIITLYYVGMALGRFLSGILAARLSSWKLIHLGQTITIFAILLLFLPLPSTIAAAGLFFIGLGNSPIFPNLIHLTPENFGKDISQSVMGMQMAASYAGIMLIPPIFGLWAQKTGTDIFPLYLLIMLVVMLFGTYSMLNFLKKRAISSNHSEN